MADEEKNLNIKIGTEFDGKGAKAAADAVSGIKDGAKKSTTDVGNVTKEINNLGKATDKLKSAVFTVGSVGTLIGGGILKATTSYINAANMATGTSRSWLSATYQIEQSYMRLGKVGAEQVLPWLKTAADYSSKAAAWAEKNPELVKVGAAAGVIGMGATGVVGGISVLQKVAKFLGIGGAAAGAGAGAAGAAGAGAAGAGAAGAAGVGAGAAGLTAGGVLAAVLGGLLAGVGGNELLANTQAGQKAGLQRTNVIATVIAKEIGDAIGKVLGDSDLGNKWASSVGYATGAIPRTDMSKDDVTKPKNGPDSDTGFITTSILSRMRQMDITEKYAREDYQRSIFKNTRDFYRQRGFDEDDYQRQRTRSARDFNIQVAYTEQMFYRQRAIAARDFQISLARSQQDYEIQRQRSAEDYNFSLKQIILSGDALQYYYAKRQHEIDVKRAEQDYQLQKSRSVEDFNRQQNDEAQQFAIERAHELAQYQIRRNDEEIDFEIRRKRSMEQFSIQMDDMDYEFQKERSRRWESFQESILPEIQTEADYRALMERNMTATMINNFNALMGQFANGWNNWIKKWTFEPATSPTSEYAGGLPGYYDIGGYTRPGPAVVHRGEFVLTADTTKSAEKVAKGQLTQQKIVDMMLAGGTRQGGGGGNTLNFYRGVSADEKAELRNDFTNMVLDGFRS